MSASERWTSSGSEAYEGIDEAPSTSDWESAGGDDDSDSVDDGGDPSKEHAGEQLLDLLLQLLFAGRISASLVCIVCWWAWKAGCESSCLQRFAYRPGAQSGKYQGHIDTALGVSTKSASHSINVPMYPKSSVRRVDLAIPVEVPHEELLSEIEEDPCFDDALAKAVERRRLPPSYYDHDVVVDAAAKGQSPPVPIGMFVDGVPFLKKTSFLAFWIYNLLTGTRHVVVILRKEQICSCGCRGWCTLYRVFAYITWSLTAAAAGVYPLLHFDGAAWAAGDPFGAHAGAIMKYRFALIWSKGDWAEFASTFGFPTWSHALFPCFACFVEQPQLKDVPDDLEDGLPWEPVSQEHYDDACTAAEIVAVIPDRDTHARVRANLFFDRRRAGSHGRALQSDVACGDLLLRNGDRIEPSEYLSDVFSFDFIKHFPATVLFWRPRRQSISLHRNPIFWTPGFSVRRLVPDILHCLYLGVVQNWIVAAIWFLFTIDAYRTGAVDLSLQRFKAELREYYRRHRGEGLTQVQNITRKMVGTAASPDYQPFKGAEAKHLIGFVVEQLAKHRGFHERGRLLYEAGTALRQLVILIDTSPLNVPADAAAEMKRVGVRFLRLGLRGGMRPVAKVHQTLHLLVDHMQYHGNPRFYSNFLDESLNKDLAGIAQKAYSLVWAQRIFICWKRIRDRRPRGLIMGV